MQPKPARAKSPRPTPGGRVNPPIDTQVVTLPSGLQIIVREDHSAPVTAVQAWCRAGSVLEGPWLGSGLSHVLEHMLFKGTRKRSGPRLDQEVTEAGGYFNAYTSFDRTVYWINVPSSGTRVAVDVLCDIMQDAALPPDELAKELDVIRREMDMNHDDPGHRASRRLFEIAFTRHPCRFPVIGHRDLFEQLKPEHVRAYYEERYAPNNIFFVVVGDVQTQAVVDQIRQAFQNRPGRPLAPLYLPSEPRQSSPRETVETATIALGHLHFTWHVPDLHHPDVPALDVLATLLGGGRSSRLHQKIRERLGLAHSIDAWTYSPTKAGLLGVSAIIDGPQHGPVCQAILREIEVVRSKAVSPGELNKAKKQFTAATLATRKTMQGQAQDLGGSWLVANDLTFSERYLATVSKLSPSDLLRVARTYLLETSRTHYALLPEVSCAPVAEVAEVPSSEPAKLITLRNGLRLVLKEDHRLPFIEFRLVWLGGVLRESIDNNGLTSLLTRTLLKGTRHRSAERIARDIESVGGHLDSYGGNNSFGLQLEVLRPDFDLAVELLTEIILEPEFPRKEVEREREVQIAAIRAQQDHLLKSASQLMRQRLFGRRGYGLDPLGTESSLEVLKLADLRRARAAWVQPQNAVLVVAGDLPMPSAHTKLTRALSRWKRGQTPPPPRLPASPASSCELPRRIAESRDKRQAVILLGYPGTTLLHPDRYALEILQEACSDLGSRLFLRVRDQLGLAYYVGAQHFAGLEPGFFAFYAGTAPSKVARVEEELMAEAAQLAAEGLTQAELERAKAKILGQKKIARQDLGHQALTMALDELYGLGYQHAEVEDAGFEAVTLRDVVDSAQRYLQPGNAVTIILSGTADEDQTAVARSEADATEAGGSTRSTDC